MNKIFYIIKLLFFIRHWKKLNKHNRTYPGTIFDINSVKVGIGTYGELNVKKYGKNNHLLQIGNYCSMANETVFLIDGEHNLNTISSYPFKQDVLGISGESLSKGDIIIGDDVWIGYRSVILSGVHIGQGAVIASGSVVTKDIPPYSIVGGVPARILKYRFSQEIINELLKTDYNKLTDELIKEHIVDLYMELKDKSQLEWLPKK